MSVHYHLSGLSFRAIGNQQGISGSSVFRANDRAISRLPHCADVTRQYCNRFSGILLVDGKYVKVKGYDRKIPVVYGIDYLTHDIPTYIFSLAENYQTCLSLFNTLRLLNYPLKAIVCDDNINFFQACLKVYPQAIIQLCQNHYKQSLRLALGLGTDTTYLLFMRQIEKLFDRKIPIDEFKRLARSIYDRYQEDPRCASILADIQRRLPQLCSYHCDKRIPRTSNLIESYNSHLEGRLKTIKGFQTFSSANRWLNAYFIKRRVQPFTDCEKQFKHLNGKCSLQLTMKDKTKLDQVLKLIR